MDLIIDNEFRDLLPPLPEEKRAQLEENLLRDGIRDPLVVWNGILIDGHNRYELAKKHGLEFATTELHFADRNEALHWIITNQLGRRNLSAYDRSILALKLKPVIAAKAKENLSTHTTDGYQGLQKSAKPPIETRAEIAKAAGVSHDTIAKVEKIEAQASPEIKAALRSGDMSINQAFKAVKQAEKQTEIADAKAEITAQTVDEHEKPTLFVGDGIGFVPGEPYKLLLTDPPLMKTVTRRFFGGAKRKIFYEE